MHWQHHCNASDYVNKCIKKDLIKLTLSQFVAEIHEDDFNAFKL